MTRKFLTYVKSNTVLFAILLAVMISAAAAKEIQQNRLQDNGQSAPEPQQADGRRHGLPPETFAVVAGTTLGMLIADVPVVFIGKLAANKIPFKAVRIVAAGLFALLAVLTLVAN